MELKQNIIKIIFFHLIFFKFSKYMTMFYIFEKIFVIHFIDLKQSKTQYLLKNMGMLNNFVTPADNFLCMLEKCSKGHKLFQHTYKNLPQGLHIFPAYTQEFSAWAIHFSSIHTRIFSRGHTFFQHTHKNFQQGPHILPAYTQK